MKRINFGFCAIVALAAMLTSCIKEQIVDSPVLRVPSKTICFGMPSDWGDMEDVTRTDATPNRVCKHDLTSEDGELRLPVGVYVEERFAPSAPAETRGTVIKSADGITSFNVWAEFTNTSNETIEYFSDVTYEDENKSGVFYPENEADEYYWPGSGTLDFVAVAGASDAFLPVTADGAWTGYFQYTTPADATAQNDIMLAYAPDVAGDNNASVPLTFRHIMAAVNIKIGSVVAGDIRSIKLTNVYNQGVFDPSANRWTVDETSTADFAVKMDGDKFTVDANTASGTLVNATNATFLFIPQEPMTGAEMIVEFYDEKTGHLYADGDSDTEHNALRGKIEGDIWDMAKTVNYNLSIDENFTLTIEPQGKKLDAHFIISDVNVTVKGIDSWRITAVADDSAPVTILPKDEANPLAQLGFWTDKEVDADGDEGGSARGNSSYDGTGEINSKPFLLFIPENISDKDRQISIILQGKGNATATTTKILLQKNPNWTANDIGWEVVDDEEAGKYGFKWTRKVSYIFPYKLGSKGFPVYAHYTEAEARALIQGFIDTYDASDYVTYGTFTHNYLTTRIYIQIDYTKLNNITGATSSSDGWVNTLALYDLAGSAATGAFEAALNNTYKTESGKEGEKMFRLAGDDEIEEGVPAHEGSDADLSGILEYILKKNEYQLYKEYNSTIGSTTYFVKFNRNDLLWYLPAYGQFTGVDFTPEDTTDSAADYWSSTAINGDSYSYIGSGDPKDRDETFAVIAGRKNVNDYGNSPATVTVDNTSMAGGENGTTDVWVAQ
ncbi:MAG: fimbrillin family protein [Alistipes sp.]|nr:fimbrillin family protein [Alistipes sp.]